MGLVSTIKNTALVASIFSAISGVKFLANTIYTTYENYMDAPTPEEIDLLHSADSGDLDRLRYFCLTHPELWKQKAFSVGVSLCINGHLACLKYWHHKIEGSVVSPTQAIPVGHLSIEIIHDAALRTKHIDCFKYYIANSTRISVYDIYNIICFGNLEHLRYLIEVCRFPILGMDMHIEYNLAVRLNSCKILDYLHELGFREICNTIVCVPTKTCMYVYPTEEEQALLPTTRFLDTVYWDGQKKNGSSITGGICSYEEYPRPSYILGRDTYGSLP